MRALHSFASAAASVCVALVALLSLAPAGGGASAQSLQGRRAAARLLANSSIAGIVDGIRGDSFSCQDVIGEQLRRIEAYNGSLKAFIRVDKESAMTLAREKDRQGGIAGSLHCVPVAVKDNVDQKGAPTTSGSLALARMTAAADSAVVTRIQATGGIVIGKTNMAEMSDSGISSESTLGGVCANPWDLRRSCLGSSGGSGAAVAAGLAVVGIGTDTEGSVIGPCAASGLLCVRPTQGPVFEAMRTGVYPAFEKQDLVGIMAKTKADYLTAHDAIYGVDYTTTVGNTARLDNVTIRFLDNFYEAFPLGPGLQYQPDPEIVRLHNIAAQRLGDLGASIQRYKTDMADLGAKLQKILTATSTKPNCSNSCMKKSLDNYFTSYAATGPFYNASDLLSVLSGFPASYQDKLRATLAQAGADVCGSTACGPYDQGRADVTAIMTDLMGNATVLAMLFTAKLPQLNSQKDVSLADQISPALNPYTGWPSLSLPVGFSTSDGSDQPQGMPVSLVLISTASQEPLLLGVASAYLNRHPDVRTPKSAPELTVDGASAAIGASVSLVTTAAASLLLLLTMAGRAVVA